MDKEEEYYYNFFKKTKCAVFILEINSISYANEASLNMFGYEKNEILSLHPSELSPKFQDDGQVSIIKADAMILIALETGFNIFEWQHLRKDGSIFWTEIVLTTVVHNHKNTIFALIKDIDKRKNYEFKLSEIVAEQEFLLNNITDFIYKLSPDNKLVYVSASVINITGYTKEEWIENSNKYFIDEYNDIILDIRDKIFKEKIQKKKYNIKILNKNRSVVVLELIESYYNKNNFLGIIGVAKNITERYQNEMMLLKSQKMELISNLSTGLVHELNNNLSVILGNADLLNRKLVEDEHFTEENISNIKTATEKAYETLSHILTISKKQSNILKKIDLNELALDIFAILRNGFSKSVDLHLNLSKEEANVKGDLSQLEHMLLNILINSYQAIFNKGAYHGVINLGISRALKNNNDYWLIEVSDTGIGISEEVMPMIFDQFFSTKDNNELGLGLTSSRNIVKAHNGFMEVDSEENVGTTVRIFIPIYKGLRNSNNTKTEDVLINKTILLIDDEPLIITTSTAILKEFGYSVISSLNGYDGVDLFKKNLDLVDLVILDMDMPNKSGKEVYYELKKIKNDVKVIISSGFENDSRVQDVLNDGVLDFIPKPYGISVFISKVNKYLMD
jgi:PAS domain S-box-containing protein